MLTRPGEWLGLPPGVPDLFRDLAPFRWVLVTLAVTAAAFLARRRLRSALLAALAFALAAVLFWILYLGRPYGVLVEPGATRRAVELAVVAESGRADEGFLAGEPRAGGLTGWVGPRLARLALPALSFLPLVLLPLSALALHRLGGASGAIAALLWLFFSTGDLDTLRGVGFATGIWRRPGAASAWVLLLGALALLRPWLTTVARGLGTAAVLIALWMAFPFADARLAPSAAVLLLTADQALWIPLAAAGLWQRRDPPAVALLSAGAALVIAGAGGAALDTWGAHAFYRAGLILAAAEPLRAVAERFGAWLQEARPRLRDWNAAALGGGLLLACTAPGAALAWWEPTRLDPDVRASAEPLAAGLAEPMEWIRRETPKGAVLLASPEYAPTVLALAGRRVLRAPTLLTPGDDERRRRLERAVLVGPEPPAAALLERYGLRYVLVGPGDFQDLGIRAPHELAARPWLALRHVSVQGLRVYEILGGNRLRPIE